MYASPLHPKIRGVHRGLRETLDVPWGEDGELAPPLFWTSALTCQHSGGWHKYLGKEAPWPPWPGQPWNHVQGTVAWTRWGGAENCRSLLQAGLPSNTSDQSQGPACSAGTDAPQPALGVLVAAAATWASVPHCGLRARVRSVS